MSRHHHHDPAPPPCCSCCACGCSPPPPAPCGGSGGGYYPAPSPQPAPGSDQLLHAIAAHLLLNSAPPPPPQPQAQPPPQPQPQHHPQQPQHQPQPQPQPHPHPAAHHANLYATYAYQYQHQQQQQQGSAPHAAYPQPPAPAPPPPQQHHHQHQPNPPDHGQLLLHSLLRRVAALETTLPHAFPSVSAPHPQQPNPRRHHRAHAHQEDPPSPPPPRRARRGPPSERELAARTIQEHFRRFLARRSRTLRQLKELAMLRAKAASLRASLSGSGHRRCKDPMAISEAALGMLYRVDGIQGRDPMIREGKHAVSRELGRILEFVDKVLLREQEEMSGDGAFDDYPEGCRGGNRPTVNKKVSFHGNEANNDADESSESSSSAEADERKAANNKKSANGKPGLAAPVPVHMESRRTPGEM
ncbi:BAG family molecular chaperone regulator 8, chloroplastic [Hordeum vulgare]|nr:BAG family molecular chaperone regulator 8, chloroplastic [Hordeum vulgare]